MADQNNKEEEEVPPLPQPIIPVPFSYTSTSHPPISITIHYTIPPVIHPPVSTTTRHTVPLTIHPPISTITHITVSPATHPPISATTCYTVPPGIHPPISSSYPLSYSQLPSWLPPPSPLYDMMMTQTDHDSFLASELTLLKERVENWRKS